MDLQTSYFERRTFLDGIRGWASVVIIISHVMVALLSVEPKATFSIWRLLTNADAALGTSFVLTGFVLSTRFFQTGQLEPFGELAIRRYLRLTIPIFLTCVLYYVVLVNGWMASLTTHTFAPDAWVKRFYHFDATAGSLLRFAFLDVYINSHSDFVASYNSNLWIMPLELWGSIGIFLCLHLLRKSRGKCSPVWVYAIAGILLAAFYAVAGISLFPFLAGVVFADCFEKSWFQEMRSSLKPLVLFLPLLIPALLIASMSRYYPHIETSLVQGLVAVCLVLSVLLNKRFSGLFENRLSYILGRLAFSRFPDSSAGHRNRFRFAF